MPFIKHLEQRTFSFVKSEIIEVQDTVQVFFIVKCAFGMVLIVVNTSIKTKSERCQITNILQQENMLVDNLARSGLAYS